MRDRYLQLRRQYEPETLRLIIVGESPPASGLYFYDATGRTGEPLFVAITAQFGITPSTKDHGLRELQRSGIVLVDATYQPVDKGLSDRERNQIIVRDYPLLRADLERLTHGDKTVPVILIKANVCRLLKPKLHADGFTVLNSERSIPFPSHGNQNRFRELFGELVGASCRRFEPGDPARSRD
jgi:hypothetical protein